VELIAGLLILAVAAFFLGRSIGWHDGWADREVLARQSNFRICKLVHDHVNKCESSDAQFMEIAKRIAKGGA
jgi:hypothetical protein